MDIGVGCLILALILPSVIGPSVPVGCNDCVIRQCPTGQKLVSLPKSCCPVCIPENCPLQRCSAPACRNGTMVVPDGQCCPVCRKDRESCNVRERKYQNGEIFQQSCNTCRCTRGVVTCTKIPCWKPGTCPVSYGLPWVCAKKCSFDSDCPGNRKCCRNGCGQQCTGPASSGCRNRGTLYLDGAEIPSEESCTRCICQSGDVLCIPAICINLPWRDTYIPPGACCPVCRRLVT